MVKKITHIIREYLGSYEERCVSQFGWVEGGLGRFHGGFEAKRTSRSLAGEEAVDGGLWHRAAGEKNSEAYVENPECAAEVSYVRLKTSLVVWTRNQDLEV